MLGNSSQSDCKLPYMLLALAIPVVVGLSLCSLLPEMRCPIRTWLGISCPMCGTTRAWQAFLAGNIGGAFRYNPMFLIWGAWCAIAYLELWQRALYSRKTYFGEQAIQWVLRTRPALYTHCACLIVMFAYCNLVGV